MRAWRTIRLPRADRRIGTETILEVDVSWDEFGLLVTERRSRARADDYMAMKSKGSARERAAVLAACRRLFEPEAYAVVEAYVAAHPRSLPLFRPAMPARG